MSELTPPDYERCQCYVTPPHGAFNLGPPPRAKRCDAVPDFIIVEVVPDPRDGQRGSMSLCLECSKHLPDETRKRVQFQPIVREEGP